MQVQEIRSFSGGENTSAADGMLPKERARQIRGMECDRLGKLRVTKGISTLYTPGTTLLSLTRYVNTSIKRLVWATSTIVYTQDESAALAPANIGATSGTARFAQMEEALIWTHDAGYPRVWRGTGTALEAGISAPTGAPTRTSAGAGLLDSLNKPISTYQWMYTFVDANGVESAPSPASATLAVNLEQVTVAAIRAAAWDARITTINWYRRGATVTDYYFVASSAVTVDTGIYPNTGSSYTDNIPDIDQSTVLVPRYYARPPSGAELVAAHNDRAWYGFFDSLTLWFSKLSQPEVVATDQQELADDGGFLTLPGGFDDFPLAFASTGSLLVIGRQRSIYALYGNNFNDFAFSQRANLGIINANSMVRGVNHVFFVGTDRRVYRLIDNTLDWISQDIQESLDDLTQAQMESCVLAYAQNKLCLSFGSAAPDTAYVYSIPVDDEDLARGWTEEAGLRSRMMIGAPHPTERRQEFIFVNAAGTSVVRAFGDATTEKLFSYKSGEFLWNQSQTPGGGATLVKCEELYIEGYFTTVGAAPVALVGVGYPGDGVLTTRSYSLALNTRKAFAGRLHQDLTGAYANVNITGQVVPGGEISCVALTLTPRRSAL